MYFLMPLDNKETVVLRGIVTEVYYLTLNFVLNYVGVKNSHLNFTLSSD